MKVKSILKNEDGSVLVLALILLVLLTMMGISATNTSTIEVQIAKNERIYKQNFYQTEAAVMTGARLLENTADAVLNDTTTLNWVNPPPFDLGNLDMDSGIWNSPGGGFSNGNFTVVETTGLIDLTQPSNLHTYKVYGVFNAGGNPQRIEKIIEIGYKRRF